MATEIKKTEQEWREELTPEQYHVLREAGTERAFSGQYWDCHDDGVYRCAACGAELFDAGTKFESGSGWPSFTEPKLAAAVELREDNCLRHAPHRGRVQDLRRAPGPRLRRRPARQGRAALLHQLRLTGPRPPLMRIPLPWGTWPSSARAGWSGPSGPAGPRAACSTAPTLDVAAGEIVAVLGRSGSGKSTLLHVLGGLDRPEAGTVEVAGERVTGAGERRLSALRRRHIGFVFQFFHLLPELTGEENVLLAGRVRGRASRTRRRAGGALIDRLGLGTSRARSRTSSRAASSSASRSPARSSTTRRCCSPTSRRATSTRRRAPRSCALLRELADEGRAVLLVTHEAAAAAIADRVLRLEAGRLVPA